MKKSDLRHEIAKIAKELYAERLLTSTGGNISMRDANNPEQIWITPSKVNKAEITFDMVARIDLNAEPLDDLYPASIEKHIHAYVMKNNPIVNSVVHTHPPYAIILTLAGLPFLSISVEAALIGEIPRIPFLLPGTKELGIAVTRALEKHSAVLMQNHGLVVASASLRDAADISLIIEDTAKKILTCKMLGFDPPTIEPGLVSVFADEGNIAA
jgi:autoinducer 2 (AI-2) kinase